MMNKPWPSFLDGVGNGLGNGRCGNGRRMWYVSAGNCGDGTDTGSPVRIPSKPQNLQRTASRSDRVLRGQLTGSHRECDQTAGDAGHGSVADQDGDQGSEDLPGTLLGGVKAGKRKKRVCDTDCGSGTDRVL